MNDATVIEVTDRVAAYVREVRAELADLPMDDVDDLTGGMEADLTELATESGGDFTGRLGSPGQYAAELRADAGLSELVAGRSRQLSRLRVALTPLGPRSRCSPKGRLRLRAGLRPLLLSPTRPRSSWR